VSTEEFALARLDPTTAYLEVDNTRIDGAPVFDALVTSADGISGAWGPPAAIGVAELSAGAVFSGEYRARRESAAHAGLVIGCQGAQPGLALVNTEQLCEPPGRPELHVSAEARERVPTAAARGSTALT
jgi:hypothetical protein